MALPLYLAMTAAEMRLKPPDSAPCAYMACHFSPYTEGITNIPESLPEHSILILNDRTSCCGHSADLVAKQLTDAAERLNCESILLDFQRPPEPESLAHVETIVKTHSRPVAVTESFAKHFSCPVFLAPAPLHIPLVQHLAPWEGREIWLEAALCQEEITVTSKGATVASVFPAEQLSGGFFDETLCCHYRITTDKDRIRFTLFDTHESLEQKLAYARELGVTRAIGLWQELGTFLPGKSSA